MVTGFLMSLICVSETRKCMLHRCPLMVWVCLNFLSNWHSKYQQNVFFLTCSSDVDLAYIEIFCKWSCRKTSCALVVWGYQISEQTSKFYSVWFTYASIYWSVWSLFRKPAWSLPAVLFPPPDMKRSQPLPVVCCFYGYQILFMWQAIRGQSQLGTVAMFSCRRQFHFVNSARCYVLFSINIHKEADRLRWLILLHLARQ